MTKVEFYQNGVLRSTDTSYPYSHAWSISSSNNGTHNWTAKAYDASSNVTTSGTVVLTVNISIITPLAVTITSPASGTTYTTVQTVYVAATASPSTGVSVSKVEFYDNGVLRCTDSFSPYECPCEVFTDYISRLPVQFTFSEETNDGDNIFYFGELKFDGDEYLGAIITDPKGYLVDFDFYSVLSDEDVRLKDKVEGIEHEFSMFFSENVIPQLRGE